MPLSVSTDLTIITSAESADSGGWQDLGGGSGSAQETDFSVQGDQSRTRAVSGASASRGMVYDITIAASALDFSVSGTHEDMLVYIWVETFAPGLVDALASAPGMRIRLASDANPDTGAWSEWDIMYSDLLASEGTELYKMYVLDPRAPPTRTNGGGVNLAAVRWFGGRYDSNATAKGQNFGIDQIAYGFGEIIVSGTATDDASGLNEMVDWDWDTAKVNRYGILVKDAAGGVQCKGKLVIGDDAGTAATAFTAQDTSIRWAPTFYYDGTRVRPTIGYDSSGNWTGYKSDGSFYFGVDYRGNGTGDTAVKLGAAVGSDQGRSGPTFIGSRQIPTGFTGDDGAVELVELYGVTFEDFRSIDLASNAASDLMRSCTFKNCGSLDIGLVEGRNNTFINGLGAAYTFLEYFTNETATAAEQLSTADPITEWTDSLNGADWSVPSATAMYVELLGGTTRTNLTITDDDKVGADNHYAECIIRFPAAGAGQGTLGPVIACHATVDDYFWVEVDLASDTIELFRVDTGTPTSIAGPTAFTMDEDEDYLVLLRRNGTTIEAFASGNSVADGAHTTKLSATDSAHTGASQRLVGLRGDALVGQTGATGERPRARLFGAGPITDNFGSLVFPAAGDLDFTDARFINNARAFGFDTTGTYTLINLGLSGNILDAQNDSGGLVTGNIQGGDMPANVENLGASTSDFPATVTVKVTAKESVSPFDSIELAFVVLKADSGGDLPAGDTVTITRSGSVATVSHTAHGVPDGTRIWIEDADQNEYNGVHVVTFIDVDSYSYTVSGTPTTPATGTIKATSVILFGDTNASGVLEDTGFAFTTTQPVIGDVKKGSWSPCYVPQAVTGNIVATTGFDGLALMASDE